MNEIFRRRLIGLAVLLVLVFILSLLLPKGGSQPGDGDVPSTTVALGVLPTPSSAPVVRPPADAPPASALQLAPALKPVETSAPPPIPRPAAGKPQTPAAAKVIPPIDKPVTKTPAATAAKPSPAVTPSTPAPKPQLIEAPSLSKPAVAAAVPPPVAKPAAAGASTAVEAKAAGGALWYVQIGSFADTGNAQTTLSLLQNIGYRGESARITNGAGKALFRVRLGPFPTEAVAKQALDKVSRQGYPQARLASETRPQQ